MSKLIYTLIAVSYLTTGRRIYALKLCLMVANGLGLEGLSALLEETIAHETATIALERAWARSKNRSTARGRATFVDKQIDGLLGIIHSSLANNVGGLDENAAAASASQRILEQIFPQGVKPIISLPFEDQLAVNDVIISRLKEDLREDADRASVGHFVQRLESLNDEFREELRKPQTKEIDYEELVAARDKGNLNVRYYVASVLAAYPPDGDDADQGVALLQPILEQSERMRQSRRGRRTPQDIDPDTGKEQESSNAPIIEALTEEQATA
jgi:hypothetical protein